MRSLTTWLVLAVLLLALGTLAQAQTPQPAASTDQTSATTANSSGQAATTSVTQQQLDQLRSEIAKQQKTIDDLKLTLDRLTEAAEQQQQQAAAFPNGPQYVPAVLDSDGTLLPLEVSTSQSQVVPKKGADTVPISAGWNGDHFFIKSSDGQFQIMPYGYVQTDYRAFSGDGAPANSFNVRRARFGFQGNYGKHYDFAVLIDATSSGVSLRDLYLNVRAQPEFQVQIGQFKEPFAQETLTAVTNIDFVERSLASALYPNATSAYRSPGITIHGDVWGSVLQYWAGGFNGRGIGNPDVTNQPEVIGRLRLYPWRKHKDSLFQGFAFGGSIGYGRSRGISNDLSFSGNLSSGVYNFFPQFHVNGPIERYNGEFTWVHRNWAIRAEYDQLNQFRRNVGAEEFGGLGYLTLPGVISKGWYAQGTYLITGENRPENGTPRVKHPLLGPEGAGTRGWGAWELAFRYSALQGNETGANFTQFFTPGIVPTFKDHTYEYTAGLNWYLNNWVKYQLNFNIDQLKEPSVIGQVPGTYFVFLNRIQFRF